MKGESSDDFSPRDARQKVAKADASTFAYTGRLKYTAIPGLELAGTINYQENYGQDTEDGVGSGTLYEAHAVYNKNQFGLEGISSNMGYRRLGCKSYWG